MSLTVAGHWVWDFWFARESNRWHIFFLKAPRSLGDPERRHRHATIGHAVSDDLRNWEVRPDPFPPGPVGAWDDLATWTGSVVRSGDSWWMFYTGISTADDGKVQRIGAAVSPDLYAWEKISTDPLCVADYQWYERLDLEAWYEEAWRDPWVFADPHGDGYHMFLTARADTGPAASRGVVGHATSDDLLSWTVQPPIAVSGAFGHLEVPQHVSIDGRHHLVFSIARDMQPAVAIDDALSGIGYAVADTVLGPYVEGPTRFIYADRIGTLYAGKVVADNGHPALVATLQHDAAGNFVGEVSNPFPLLVSDDGALAVQSENVER